MARAKYHEWITEESLALITGWARDGLTEEQIAHNMGVGTTTLREWKGRYPSILTALKKGKEVADYIVENALYMNATGYERKETVIDAKGNEHEIVKYYPPNTTAQIFWLKNRKPDKWRDKPVDDTESDNKKIGGIVMMVARTEEDDE